MEFVGVKGDVFFDENGDSPREVQIFQYRGELWWFDRLLFIIVSVNIKGYYIYKRNTQRVL